MRQSASCLLHFPAFEAFSVPCYWSRNLSPFSQTIRCKNETKCVLVFYIFPRLKRSLFLVIGPETSRHFLKQSGANMKQSRLGCLRLPAFEALSAPNKLSKAIPNCFRWCKPLFWLLAKDCFGFGFFDTQKNTAPVALIITKHSARNRKNLTVPTQ